MNIRFSYIILFIFFFCFEAYPGISFPKSPNLENAHNYISDPAQLLSKPTMETVNYRLDNFRKNTTAEIAVAIVPDIEDISIEEYSTALFKEWGVGKADNDNGALLVISPGARRARIETGYGMEGVLTDAACSEIIRSMIVPAMKGGNIDAAVNNATEAMVRIAQDPAYAAELASRQKESQVKALDEDTIYDFIWWVGGCSFFIALVLFIATFFNCRKKTDYAKALIWRERMTWFWLLSVLSLGTGLIFALPAMRLKHFYRNRRIKCDTCGTKMNKLSEDKDNELLNPAQDLEERLDTVDYDVWECPKCGTIERFPFLTKQSKYSPCPACGTIANHLVCSKTIIPATTRHGGKGENIYQCEYCHNQTRKPFVIPKKDNGAIIAATAIGAAAGRSGGSFGGGGGFGGGMSGGGGASGGW